MTGTLFMVATPIGNLSDLSDRVRATLLSVDAVFAEDTRVARRLLDHVGATVPVERYDHHSHDRQWGKVMEAIAAGKNVAYVSDAGVPGVEDPGGRLVDALSEAMPSAAITPIPGPSAVMSALSVSGFPADRFLVAGFAPKKKGRKKFFDELATQTITIALYESTHRIQKTVEEIAARQPERPLVIARELTKKFETILRGTARELAHRLQDEVTKGEFIVILGAVV